MFVWRGEFYLSLITFLKCIKTCRPVGEKQNFEIFVSSNWELLLMAERMKMFSSLFNLDGERQRLKRQKHFEFKERERTIWERERGGTDWERERKKNQLRTANLAEPMRFFLTGWSGWTGKVENFKDCNFLEKRRRSGQSSRVGEQKKLKLN